MADESFDPVAAGAVAVDEPKQEAFDPTQHGAIPVQHEEPSILQKTGRAVVDTLKGFLPQSVEDVALAPATMFPGVGQGVKFLSNIAFGREPSEGISPLQGIPVVQRIPQIIAAEKTPALSQERFTTGAGVVADLGMLAGFKSLLHPKLAEIAGIAKPEVTQPIEPVATTEAQTTTEATPIAPEVAQPVPEAVTPTAAPLTQTNPIPQGFGFRTNPETGLSEIIRTTPEEVTQNAVQVESPSSVLPHPQEGITETGGERVGVGQGVQGEETPAASQVQQQAGQVAPQIVSGKGEPVVETGTLGTGEAIYETTKTEPNPISAISTRTLKYAPDSTAPAKGEYITAPDPHGIYKEVAVGWRQNHEELVKDGMQLWQGSPTEVRGHFQNAIESGPQPSSGNGKQVRAQAEALLYELKNNSKPAPKLYRGDQGNPKMVQPWTESKAVARKFAGKNGKVHELPAGHQGLRLNDYLPRGTYTFEREWIIDSDVPRPTPVSLPTEQALVSDLGKKEPVTPNLPTEVAPEAPPVPETPVSTTAAPKPQIPEGAKATVTVRDANGEPVQLQNVDAKQWETKFTERKSAYQDLLYCLG